MSGRRVDINSAKVDELATLLGVGKARAEAIVERRQVSYIVPNWAQFHRAT